MMMTYLTYIHSVLLETTQFFMLGLYRFSSFIHSIYFSTYDTQQITHRRNNITNQECKSSDMKASIEINYPFFIFQTKIFGS